MRFRSAFTIAVIAGSTSFSFAPPASAACTTVSSNAILSGQAFHGANCSSAQCACTAQACVFCNGIVGHAGVTCTTNYFSAMCQAPQLTITPSSNQTGYNIAYTGTGFQKSQRVLVYLAGLTNRTRPLALGSATADKTGALSGFYVLGCKGFAASPNVTLNATNLNGTSIATAGPVFLACSL